MPSTTGRAFVIDRLTSARDLQELSAIWSDIAVSYQRDQIIYDTKERLKAQMEGPKNEHRHS